MIKQTFLIFDNKTRIKAILLYILNFISAFLEVISIGSIPILIYYLLEPNKLIEKIPNDNLRALVDNYFTQTDNSESLFFVLTSVVLLFLIKNIFIFSVNIYQLYFARKIKVKYSSLLFNNYIQENYNFFLNRNPAQFIKNIDSVHIIPAILMMSLGIIKEISIIVGLILIIAITNFEISILLMAIVLIAIFLHKFKLGEILIKQGKKSYDYQEKRYALINEFFGSITDIKVLKKESFFSNIFKNFIWNYETSITISKVINSFVRPFIETVAILIMVFAILYLSYIGKTFNEILPLLSFIGLSFIRIIPSSINLLSYMNNLKFESKQLSYLVENFSNKKNISKLEFKDYKSLNFQNSMDFKNVNFSYPGVKKKSISNISFRINNNDQIAIIGKTGSGKSTLINLICNLLKFDSGQIILDDKIILNSGDNFYLENLFYIRQDIFLLNDTIKQNIAFGIDNKEIDEELVKVSLKKVGLNQYIDNLNAIIGERGIKISGGEKQLLGLARALYQKPKILILDEPTSNLDYKSEKSYFEIIKKLKITTIVIAHRINTVENCNKVILLKDGNLIDQDTLENFKKKYDNLKNYID